MEAVCTVWVACPALVSAVAMACQPSFWRNALIAPPSFPSPLHRFRLWDGMGVLPLVCGMKPNQSHGTSPTQVCTGAQLGVGMT